MAYKVFLGLLLAMMAYSTLIYSDTIVTERRKIVGVVVKEETFLQIYFYYKMDTGRQIQEMDTKSVVRIERDKVPSEYENAENYFNLKLYPKAIEAYQRAAKAKDWTHQHALYKIGQCYQNMRRIPQAIQAYQVLLKTFPKTYYKADAMWELGQLYLESQKWEAASKAFGEAQSLYNQRNPTSPRVKEAQYRQAMTTEKSGQYAAVIPMYKAILQERGLEKTLQQEIQSRLAHCLAITKDISASRRILLDLLKQATLEQKSLLASIYLDLGLLYFQEQKIKEALICHLRVILMYDVVPDITKQAYKEALYCMDILKREMPEYVGRIQRLQQMRDQREK